MKYFLNIFLLLFYISSYSQSIELCGLDNNARITKEESKFLVNYIKEKIKDFKFEGKRIIFVTGYSGQIIGSKKEYFNQIRNRNAALSDEPIVSTVIVLTEEEKIKSGGYDAMITYWVKFLSKRKRKKIIRKIG